MPDTIPSNSPDNTAEGIKPLSSVVFFPAADLTATIDFYCTFLGFSIHHQTPQNVVIDTGYGYLGFVAYGDGRPLATGICISLNCTSRDEVCLFYDKMKAAYPIGDPPGRNARFPVYSFFMRDPNGYALEFQIIEG